MRGWFAWTMVFLMAGLAPALAEVAEVAEDRPVGLADSIYSTSLSALTILFVTAVVLESAFSVLFNWRVFLSYFSSRGVKTIVMVVASLIVVFVFDLDVIASLIAAYKMPGTAEPVDNALFLKEVAKVSGPVSSIITALVLAGGSAGVYNLMTALGFRSNREAEVAPTPPASEAWVAVKVKKVNAAGRVQVVVSKVAAMPAGKTAPPAIAGSINFARPTVKELLLRNVDRFPQNGGYVVEPNVPYQVIIQGKDAAGAVIQRQQDDFYVFAPRAIVDFQVDL